MIGISVPIAIASAAVGQMMIDLGRLDGAQSQRESLGDYGAHALIGAAPTATAPALPNVATRGNDDRPNVATMGNDDRPNVATMGNDDRPNGAGHGSTPKRHDDSSPRRREPSRAVLTHAPTRTRTNTCVREHARARTHAHHVTTHGGVQDCCFQSL